MNIIKIISLICFFSPNHALENCKTVEVLGIGEPDGVYTTLVDYRGRPDFYREDSKFNLFGEDAEDNTCSWRIDSVDSGFPYHEVIDCSYHPVDINEVNIWYEYRNGLDPVSISDVTITCVQSKRSNKKIIMYSCIGLAVIVLVALIVWGHVIIRRKRLKKAKRECPVCRKSSVDAARVIQSSFQT